MVRPALWTLVVAILILLVGCSKPSEPAPSASSASASSHPADVTLSAGQEQFVKTEQPMGGDELHLVAASNGNAWLFLKSMRSLSYAARQKGSWTEPTAIPTDGWKFINRMTVAMDKEGRPIVVWAGFDDTPGEALAALRWLGDGWSSPAILDRLETSTSVESLHTLRDPSGRVHLAYDRPLNPRESYNIGGHGMFPRKCWHAVFDGQRWSTPAPTTGPGRFSAYARGLSLGPDGRIALGIHVSLPGDPGYVAQQAWDGNTWSSIEKLKNAQSGGVVATPWGDRLLWWTLDQSFGASVVRGDCEAAVPEACWSRSTLVTADKAGRIVVCARDGDGAVHLWNGENWSGGLRFEGADAIVPTPNGNLLAARWERGGVRIQDILVRDVAATSQATQPRGLFSSVRPPQPSDLHEAVGRKDVERVREVLAANGSLALARDARGNTALMIATQGGDAAIVEMLLKAGAEADREDFMGTRPLHVAARKGLVDITRLLLDHGARVNEEDRQGKTALAYAQSGGKAELIKLLKDRGGTVKDFSSQLVKAVESGDQQSVTKLLDQGLSVETAVPNGHCLLDYAAEKGNIPMARFLISRGASVKRADEYKRTALYWASGEGKADMVAFLIEQGANPNAKEWQGMTPLHEAVDQAQCHPDDALATIKKLIAGGAQANAKNNNGVTPLGHAKTYGTDAVREYLRQNGAVE